ncbi:hypothetical protein HIM_10735 [Hirsutella minnesotensis 3608]|uniref:Reverse transcriptase domain-containing protein n=1 Tax=Hirsutella minnesotensis 3608 TaxID=1043627 RepID=A0A0F7ZJR7_9HYPO|nr:hypothetical protein HIM_10735 [Hirsutella minnesotensis 3608]
MPDGKEKEPPWGPLYGMPREELIVLRKTLTELLDKGFIRASSSPASAPVLFMRKPGGGLRFCVDYRGLNAITKKDRYPLPLIDETLRSLSKAKWLTKLDVIAAFHKIRVEEGDEWKTAFRTRYGLYEWLVTPFGLTGAPATFQRYINHTLRDFLDDKVKQVLARLRDAGLQIDIDKCDFEAKSVKYLGFIVEAGKGIRVDPEKVQAIQQWQRPRSVKGVRSFLGFALPNSATFVAIMGGLDRWGASQPPPPTPRSCQHANASVSGSVFRCAFHCGAGQPPALQLGRHPTTPPLWPKAATNTTGDWRII